MISEALDLDASKEALRPIIDKLKFKYASENLSEMISSSLGANASPSDIFFIRREVARMAKPCARLIDLRQFSSDLDFKTFSWEGMDHILDKESAQQFLLLIKRYGGEYTFGVYEGVIRHFKSIKMNMKEQTFYNNINIEPISLSNVSSRNEERMHLGVKVDVFLLKADHGIDFNDPTTLITTDVVKNACTHSLSGNTVDISLSGLQVKIPQGIASGQAILVRFVGLESDFMFKYKYISYEAIKSEHVDDKNVFMVSLRQYDLSAHNEFKLFTKRLIFANKKRYKVSLDNTFNSVESKLYEQFYLSRRKVLDLFVDNEGKIPYILSSHPALNMLDWFVSDSKEILSSLVMKDQLFVKALKSTEFYWLVYKRESDSKKDVEFFSVILETDLSFKFASQALKNGQGKVFKVSTSRTRDINAFLTSSLPRAIHREMGDETIFRYSPQLNNQLSSLRLLLTIKEVSNHEMPLFDETAIKLSVAEVASCSSFMFKGAILNQAEVVRLESNEFRKEDRYYVSTAVTIRHKRDVYIGRTSDVSTRGLAIVLENNINLPKGSEVIVSFDDLMQNESEFNLSNVYYKVVAHKEGLLRLESLSSKGFVAVLFWQKYLTNNIDKLKVVGNTESLYGLRRALRNIVVQTHSSVPAFFSVNDSRPCVKRLSLSPLNNHHPIWSAISKDFSADTQLKDLFYHKSVFKRLVVDLPKITQEMQYCGYFLMVKYEKTEEGMLIIKDVVFLSRKDVISCFRDAIDESDYCIFNVTMTKKSRLFDRYFKGEMSYLEDYAPHKASKLMFDVKTLTGVLDFDDVTSFFKAYLKVKTHGKLN